MALTEAILVCLTERPMSGYDLAKYFDTSVGFFWRASHQQIYRELSKLREKGFVDSQEITHKTRPNRIVHTITESGQTYLKEWSRKPVKFPSLKDEFLLKFYAFDNVDIDSLKDQITIRIDQHRSRLNQYKRIRERFYDDEDLTLGQKGKLMVLEMGMAEESVRLKALKSTMEKLGQL